MGRDGVPEECADRLSAPGNRARVTVVRQRTLDGVAHSFISIDDRYPLLHERASTHPDSRMLTSVIIGFEQRSKGTLVDHFNAELSRLRKLRSRITSGNHVTSFRADRSCHLPTSRDDRPGSLLAGY